VVTAGGLTQESLDASVEAQGLREANKRLCQQLVQAKDRTHALVQAVTQAGFDGMLAAGPLLPVPARKPDKRTRHSEVALWHLTDWQGGKETTSYNSQVMRERVLQFCATAQQLTEIARADHPVRECVVALGGDMVEGLFNFPTQPYEVDETIVGQFVNVSRLIVDVVRVALATYDRVLVVPEWGNHGRIGSKRAAVPRNDNIDRMTIEMSRQLLAHEKRLTWQPCPEDIQRIEIGNYRAISIHGDEIGRNGYASPQTIVAWVTRQQSGAYPWSFRDCYVGHYHNHSEHALSNGLGSVYFTGSTESDNRYAGVTMAASATPSQRLQFIDPVAGRVTSSHKVWLA